MSTDKDDLWKGLRPEARAALETRNYTKADLAGRLAGEGVPAGELVDPEGLEEAWIPGVVIYRRNIYPQRHRGFFGEFARQGEGALADIGMWPQQWATARMYAGSAKGFHIHPPFIPEGEKPERWFRKLFVENPGDFGLREYGREQWDAMFFVQGIVDMILVDERPGLPRRVMRFFIEGDDIPGENNAGVVIPAGVAHALRCANSSDLIMVYGTSTSFNPAWEGRIASGIEQAPLPEDWVSYIS